MCQVYVDKALQPIRKSDKDLKIYHYMDDVLLAHPDQDKLFRVYDGLVKNLQFGLEVAEDKLQSSRPITYLVAIIDKTFIRPQKVTFRMDRLKTLNDFQKLLGDINWVRPYLKLTTEDLGPLFDTLKGSGNLTSPREITTEARKALCKVEDAITKAHLDQVDITKPILLIIIATIGSPTGVFWQQGPTYWVHLHYSQKITLASYPELVGKLIKKAITNAIGIFGIVPINITTHYKPETLIELAQESEVWAYHDM